MGILICDLCRVEVFNTNTGVEKSHDVNCPAFFDREFVISMKKDFEKKKHLKEEKENKE